MYRPKMNLMKSAIGIATLIAFAAFAPLAAADTVVPPGNSAATQYTETFPTSNGEADVNKEIDGSHVQASKVIGKDNAKNLENHGADGEAVAVITAATAPHPVVADEPQSPPPSTENGRSKAGSHDAGAGGKGNGKGKGPRQQPQAEAEPAPRSVAVSQPSGSSGFGEVLGQMTGASSGQLGLLLPLLIIATVIWSFNYAWRHRRAVG
jgi:hypothetical protein